jgi:hypothetical protein
LYEILNGVLLEWDLKKHEIFSNRLDLLIDSSETYLFSIFIEVFLKAKFENFVSIDEEKKKLGLQNQFNLTQNKDFKMLDWCSKLLANIRTASNSNSDIWLYDYSLIYTNTIANTILFSAENFFGTKFRINDLISCLNNKSELNELSVKDLDGILNSLVVENYLIRDFDAFIISPKTSSKIIL